jgi:hypothetical protein
MGTPVFAFWDGQKNAKISALLKKERLQIKNLKTAISKRKTLIRHSP